MAEAKDKEVETLETMYNMPLHQSKYCSGNGIEYIVTRVPSGWIYSFAAGGRVFVPMPTR